MSTQPIIREAPVVETVEAANIGRPYRRLYLSVPTKFALALLLAIAWTALSVWLSQRWLNDLAAITTWAFALIAIGFIAYVPGFMNAFLLGTLLSIDACRESGRPPIHPSAFWSPPTTRPPPSATP